MNCGPQYSRIHPLHFTLSTYRFSSLTLTSLTPLTLLFVRAGNDITNVKTEIIKGGEAVAAHAEYPYRRFLCPSNRRIVVP
jgi:hypothetical protein